MSSTGSGRAWRPVEPHTIGSWALAQLPPEWASAAVTTLITDLDDTVGGGKNSRSALFSSTYRALGGEDEATRVAMSHCLHYFHEALLVHDDLADGDTVRRGHLNLAGRTLGHGRAEGLTDSATGHLSVIAGLLGGDLLLVAGFGALARIDAPIDVRQTLHAEVQRVLVVTIAGEYDDAHSASTRTTPTVAQALAIAEAKTAEYSTVLPLVAAGILTGAPAPTIAALRRTGRHLGIAYQIVDDVLGVFGDTAQTGKSVDTDLTRRAPTIVRALATHAGIVDDVDRAVDRSIGQARTLLDAHGIREQALLMASDHIEAARQSLTDPSVPHTVRDALEPHVATVVGRTQ